MKKVHTLSALLLVLVMLASGCESPEVNVEAEKTLTLNGITVHYSGDVSASEAKALINFIKDTLNPDEMSAYVKRDNGYTVGLVTTYTSPEEIEDLLKFYLPMIASEMSQEVFEGSHVTLQLLDEEKNVLFSTESKYHYVTSNRIYVWYSEVGEDKANTVLNYALSLVGEGPWDIILEKSGDTYHVRAMSGFTSREEVSSVENEYKKMLSDLEKELNGNVVLHVLDSEGNEIAVFNG
ncbi:hypothetical protein OCC_08879 [Thermococcus litoralis DSM 5473]|uniref:Uncharacterized protein n=1 Tax=Thermococcus litoralis (strain ATCC 51850 / DSM 5473 / JCM 8560 / NS-C) TaxID=523849 RepID=H3ZKA0_THELN|nr:hypothetical protein [Thermococcus litoralis]EHR79653.1 hypothetical protein OCC_08879 [Thermococcus litoralis DSM 5473]